MIIDIPDEYDSKFRFILVAAERAKQLQNGYPPMIDEKSPKPAHIAIREAQQGLITWEILEEADEDAVETEFDGSEEY
jgi:DNA-directed RNA polymerase subunit omega